MWIAGYRLIEYAMFLLDLTVDQRNVRLEDCTSAKLIGEVFVCFFCFSDDQQTRSAFVQTMHNSRSGNSSRERKLFKMKGKRIRQRAKFNSGGRMDHHAGGLV